MSKDQMNDLILKDICFSYYYKGNKKLIFENFSYNIKKGKFTSIIGPSGTGKTSLLKLISGIIKPEKGKIKFKNENLKNVMQLITLIQQSPSLMPWLNVYNNIKLANNPNAATCGKVCVAEVEELVPVGSINPDHIHTPGIFVNRIIEGTHEKRIENLTLTEAGLET